MRAALNQKLKEQYRADFEEWKEVNRVARKISFPGLHDVLSQWRLLLFGSVSLLFRWRLAFLGGIESHARKAVFHSLSLTGTTVAQTFAFWTIPLFTLFLPLHLTKKGHLILTNVVLLAPTCLVHSFLKLFSLLFDQAEARISFSLFFSVFLGVCMFLALSQRKPLNVVSLAVLELCLRLSVWEELSLSIHWFPHVGASVFSGIALWF